MMSDPDVDAPRQGNWILDTEAWKGLVNFHQGRETLGDGMGKTGDMGGLGSLYGRYADSVD